MNDYMFTGDEFAKMYKQIGEESKGIIIEVRLATDDKIVFCGKSVNWVIDIAAKTLTTSNKIKNK